MVRGMSKKIKKVCKNCGKDFTPMNNNKVYCYDPFCENERARRAVMKQYKYQARTANDANG